jgi:hypothetical protein
VQIEGGSGTGRLFPAEHCDSPSQFSDKIMNPNAESICHNLQRLNRHVALPALDLTYVSPIEPGAIGKDILGPTAL